MAEDQPKAKISRSKFIAIGVSVAAIIGVLVVFGMSSGGEFSLIPQEHSEQIVKGIIRINPGTYQYYQLIVPSGATDARIEGTFTASGGSGNDILVMLFPEDGFVNWKYGYNADNFYFSGKVIAGQVGAVVPSGEKVYLVFDNSFSLISSKTVNTDIKLIYFK